MTMKVNVFHLERCFARHEFTALYLLCTLDCESIPLGELLALDPGPWERFSALRLGCTESLGHTELRKSIMSGSYPLGSCPSRMLWPVCA